MTKTKSWLAALNEAAKSEDVKMPRFNFDVGGMGAATSDPINDRYVTLKHRLDIKVVPTAKWIQWSLWEGRRDRPELVASFNTPSEPAHDDVSSAFLLLKGWLHDKWTSEKALEEVRKNKGHHNIKATPRSAEKSQEYWLSEDRKFGFVVRPDSWTLVAGAERFVLEIEHLRAFCGWLAAVWDCIAFGNDVRPPAILETGVSAAQAFGEAPGDDPECKEWWGRHAAKAAAAVLPDVFFERQADDLVISWDKHVWVLGSASAVPVLRSLIESHSGVNRIGGLLKMAYRAIAGFNSAATRDWLKRYDFSEKDARELANSGVCAHPIVGLLRSGKGSSLATADYDVIFGLLKPSKPESYKEILSLVRGLRKSIDPWQPWDSGYMLANSVRERLNYASSDKVDVEALLGRLGVEALETQLQDASVLGACIGSVGYAPLVVTNSASPDASGTSGRRTTVAHELCHLLFDRGAYKPLARFEGARAVGDRLIEMRANAFAIELLVPMVNLEGVTEDMLSELAKEWQVSTHALVKHLHNYRKRL